MVISVAASKLETQDLVSVVASSLTARGFGVSVSVSPFRDSERVVSVAAFPVTGLKTGLSVSISPLRDSEQGVSFGKLPSSLSDEEEIAIWRFSISRL